MKKRLTAAIGSVVLAAAATTSILMSAPPASAAVGLHVSGANVLEANGNKFIMRGISHAYVWYTSQNTSFANIKATGANTVRVVLGGGRWGPTTAAEVTTIISLCKTNKLICVLEVHDTAGYGEDTAAASLDEAVNYWISIKSALVGQESYVAINIGNEPIGNTNPSQWTAATVAAVQKMRTNGFEHMLVVDAPNWGQDWQYVMRDNAQTVLDADTQKNTLLSIHMYSVFNTAASIVSYLDAIKAKGWPLIIGEFGWQYDSTQVDDATVMAEAQSRGIGYLGWSWSGNTDPILDMVLSFDPAQTTTWYSRIINGTNGIKATSKEATIYSGTTTSSAAASSSSARPSSAAPSSSAPSSAAASSSSAATGRTCTAAFSNVGQWTGGFQGDVKVTAGSSAITGWTVTLTWANGQTITQAWNATVTTSGTVSTAKNVSYNGSLAAGGTANFGFLGSWTSTNSAPAVTCAAS